MKLKVTPNINEVAVLPNHWTTKLLKACEHSGVVGEGTGWQPLYFSDGDHFGFSYIKSHSYGEYIFDWAWADLYQRVGLSYYPKMLHALPFTPVNAKKIFSSEQEGMIQYIHHFYQQQKVINSDHWLFLASDHLSSLKGLGYFHQKTIQYHFENIFESFDHYLDLMKMRKRKQIKKERKTIERYGLKLETKRITDLSSDEIEQVFQLYLTTIEKKYSMAYLNRDFFLELKDFLNEEALFNLAYKDEQMIAMGMFIESHETLYGRYWGILPEYHDEYSFLHFELCYYRGIEYVIKRGLKTFEAGAQGEQKLLRGFKPVIIHSMHHLKNKELSRVVENHVKLTNEKVESEVERLATFLPFKEV